MQKYLQKIQKINQYINEKNSHRSENEILLLKAAKLPEEIGELYQEILKQLEYVRDDKTIQPDALGFEFADVVITALVLAQHMKIDIDTCMEQKLDVILQRLGIE